MYTKFQYPECIAQFVHGVYSSTNMIKMRKGGWKITSSWDLHKIILEYEETKHSPTTNVN